MFLVLNRLLYRKTSSKMKSPLTFSISGLKILSDISPLIVRLRAQVGTFLKGVAVASSVLCTSTTLNKSCIFKTILIYIILSLMSTWFWLYPAIIFRYHFPFLISPLSSHNYRDHGEKNSLCIPWSFSRFSLYMTGCRDISPACTWGSSKRDS